MAILAIAAFLLGLTTMAVFERARRRFGGPLSSRGTFWDDHALKAIDQLFELTPNGLGLCDRGLRFRRVNQALAAISGCAADDHIGKTFHDMIPAIAAPVEPLFRQVL